ncbi:MAG: hypothetical protein JWO04_5436 [Gammaproteobacteria bacterium]|jgi:hypothetical protein|nr:hypothetical protein [Gammaproteobacteria bacterium]
MQAEVIDLLSGKGKFPTEQALVLAEAIDMAIEKTQFVTVPILDARFAAVNARIDSLEARMDLKLERWAVRMVIAMLLSQTALGPIGMGALDAVRRALSTLVH